MFQDDPPVLLNYSLATKSRVHVLFWFFPLLQKYNCLLLALLLPSIVMDYCENRARTVLFGVDFKKQCDNIQYN